MHDAVTDWQELSALYERADLLTGDALEEWLATLREPPHPLLEPLLQMLEARSEIQGNGFLDALPALAVEPRGAAADWKSGARIGPYRLEARLGSGGMAEVWRAQRADGAFQRTVAIKLLFRHVGGPAQQAGFAQRFSRERDILASLHHPNIAALHDAGVTPAGQPWLALELVEGEPLTDWCDRTKLGVRGRVELFLQVLLAVQHAHANLVIHRDLKPANILVTAGGQVRLLDFGIAKLMEEGGDAVADTELTRHAGRLMTVRYASPEQLTGQPLTTACDVYSLGVVLYELLCGELPYEPKVASPAQFEQAILDVEPRPPSRRALTSAAAQARGGSDGLALRRLLGHELDAVVLRALAKRPNQRYASVEALRVELGRWLAGEPVEARAPTGAYRLRKFVGRHLLGVSLGSAAVLALMAVATAAVWLGLQAKQESARATAARDFMMGMFKQADSDKSHGADMTARQLLDRGRDDVLKRLSAQPALQADLLQGIAGIQGSMREDAKADLTYAELAKVYGRMGEPVKEALAVAKRAENALRMTNMGLAHSLVEQAAQIAGPARLGDPELAVSLGLTRGWMALWEGHPERAKSLFRDALERAQSTFGMHAPPVLEALLGIVNSESNLHDFDAALLAQKDLAARQMLVADKTPRDVVELDVSLGYLLYSAGRYREVSQLMERAIPACHAAIGVNDAQCRRLSYVSARAHTLLGTLSADGPDLHILRTLASDYSSPDFQVASAMALFRAESQLGILRKDPDLLVRVQALADPRSAQTISPARCLLAIQELAADALRRGSPQDAERWLSQAMEIGQASGDKASGYAPMATTRLLMGIALLAGNRASEALAMMQTAQQGEAEVLGASHPLAMLYFVNQAEALAALNQVDEALAVVHRAESVLQSALGADSPTYHRLIALQSRLQMSRNYRSPLEPTGGEQTLLSQPLSAEHFEFFN